MKQHCKKTRRLEAQKKLFKKFDPRIKLTKIRGSRIDPRINRGPSIHGSIRVQPYSAGPNRGPKFVDLRENSIVQVVIPRAVLTAAQLVSDSILIQKKINLEKN